MAFGKDIKKLREEAPISVQKLADLIGVDADRWRKWEQKDLDPRLEDTQLIEAFFGMTLNQIRKLTSIKKFLKVPNKHPQPADYLSSRFQIKQQNLPYLVPLIPFKAQAGYLRAFDQVEFLDTLEKYALPPGVDPRGAEWRYFEVQGDSMEPTFFSGDIILGSMVPLEDWQQLRNFYIYVIVTHESLLIKRIFRKTMDEWVLISDNEKKYDQQLIDARIIRELWVFRRHIQAKAPVPHKFEIKV